MTGTMSKDGGGKSENQEPASATIELRSSSMVLAGIRHRLAIGMPPERGVLDSIAASLSPLPSASERDPAAFGALIALMDELAGLVGQLEFERDALRQRIRAWAHHRRAQSTYTAGRPPR